MASVSVLLIIAMLFTGFSGLTGLAADPEMQNVQTVKGLTVTVGEETYAFSSDIVTVRYADEGTYVEGFYTEKNGKERMPLFIRYTQEGIDLLLNDTDNYYTVLFETLTEDLGLEEGLLQSYGSPTEVFGGFMEMLTDREELFRVNRDSMEALAEAAGENAVEKDVPFGDAVLHGVEAEMDSRALAAWMDLMIVKNDKYGAYMSSLLEMVNEAAGRSYASFSEFIADEAGDEEAEGIYRITAACSEDGSIWYTRTESEGTPLSIHMETVWSGDDYAANGEIISGPEADPFSMVYSAELTHPEDGGYAFEARMDLGVDVVVDVTVSVESEEEIPGLEAFIPEDRTYRQSGSFSIAIASSGDAASSVTNITGSIGSGTLSEGGETDGMEIGFSADCTVTAGEEGSFAADISLTAGDIPGVGSLGVSFSLDSRREPYEDLFTGTQNMVSVEDGEGPLLSLIISDVIGFAGDLVDLLAEAGIYLDTSAFMDAIGGMTNTVPAGKPAAA